MGTGGTIRSLTRLLGRMEAAFPAITPVGGLSLGPMRIRLAYFVRHGRLPDLQDPALFTELVQDRKLNDRDLRLAFFADKVRVKAEVARRIGADWITPTLWHGRELPDRPCWPEPFVVKSRHGCNQTAFVPTGAEDWRAIRKKSERWMGQTYGYWLDEWLYEHIPKGILVEPFIGSGTDLPVDFKFYVFAGRVEVIQVHLGRGKRHRWILLDRSWSRVSAATQDPDPARPYSFYRMMEAAEELGRDLDFVRVDLYDVDRRPRFGELTFYPGSGLDRFDPVTLDQLLGKHWLQAKSSLRAGSAASVEVPATLDFLDQYHRTLV
jgi:hypothetical protein